MIRFLVPLSATDRVETHQKPKRNKNGRDKRQPNQKETVWSIDLFLAQYFQGYSSEEDGWKTLPNVWLAFKVSSLLETWIFLFLISSSAVKENERANEWESQDDASAETIFSNYRSIRLNYNDYDYDL